MNRDRLDQAAVGLGLGAIACGLLIFVPFRSDTLGAGGTPHASTPASLTLTTTLLLIVMGVATLVAGYLGGGRGRTLVLLVGLAFAVVALLLLVKAASGGPELSLGNSSTMALFGGFALGLLTVGLTPPLREPEQ